MTRFRKTPVTIEAFCLGNEPPPDWFFQSARKILMRSQYCKITTLKGVMMANKGDWIIRDVEGEIYPCTPDEFKKTYVEVEND